MPRRKRLRKIVAPPGFKGYRPFGNTSRNSGFIELLYEEYEAIKLADYDLLNHQEAADLMGVSRPTFARIYESARRKIARAFVETKEIRTFYGNAWMNENWYRCLDCSAKFTIPLNLPEKTCPLCKSVHVELIA
ncbi:MAG: DUF134 domain-containing protein [Bacteroidales bacterium]|nr:DUF134 domain-containing protein [Bacteroidales bacterium]MBN2698502.1 DUF134 domain-containing protein [Bacteroidales bacterium]